MKSVLTHLLVMSIGATVGILAMAVLIGGTYAEFSD